MRAAPIPSRWLSLDPSGRIDAAFWLSVVAALRAAGIEPAKVRLDPQDRGARPGPAVEGSVLPLDLDAPP